MIKSNSSLDESNQQLEFQVFNWSSFIVKSWLNEKMMNNNTEHPAKKPEINLLECDKYITLVSVNRDSIKTNPHVRLMKRNIRIGLDSCLNNEPDLPSEYNKQVLIIITPEYMPTQREHIGIGMLLIEKHRSVF